MYRMNRCRGFTLLELLIVLMVAAVLAAAAVPGLDAFILNARRTADVNGFVTAVQLARGEAFKRGRPVVLCKTADGTSCGGTDVNFDDGWMVFVNRDGDSPPRRDADEPQLYAYRPGTSATITANRRLFEFRPFGRRSTNGTVTFCDRRGAEQARAVVVSFTGRPRVTRNGPGMRPVTCEF